LQTPSIVRFADRMSPTVTRRRASFAIGVESVQGNTFKKQYITVSYNCYGALQSRQFNLAF